MAVRSTTRPLWRLPLVLFLSAPILSLAVPTAERDSAIEFAILSPFTLLPSENVVSHPGYLVAAIDAEPRDPSGFRRHLMDDVLRSLDCSFDRNPMPGDPIR
jgi:hypothetical protein